MNPTSVVGFANEAEAEWGGIARRSIVSEDDDIVVVPSGDDDDTALKR